MKHRHPIGLQAHHGNMEIEAFDTSGQRVEVGHPTSTI
jgi:hypothetical protein